MGLEVTIKTSSGPYRVTLDTGILTIENEANPTNAQALLHFGAAWLALLSDSPLADKRPFRVYKRFLRTLRADGFKTTIVRFADYSHKLLKSLYGMGTSSLNNEFVEEMLLTPVAYEYIHFFNSGDPLLLRWILSFLNFGKKLEFDDPSFALTALRDWESVEKGLASLVLPADVTDGLKAIAAEVLPVFEITDWYPKFGPGSVAEKGVRLRAEKIDIFAYDGLIDRFLLRGHLGFYGDAGNRGLSKESGIPNPDMWSPEIGSPSSRTSVLKFVPKNLKTYRSICMEPNTVMYAQQGILRTVLELLERSPLRRFIDIGDQTKNQLLAVYGSLTGNVDTIDLTSASDTLSYELLKRVFPKSWQIALRVTRTSEVYIPLTCESVKVRKFAPMGSALCFPTQSIMFALVSIYVAAQESYNRVRTEATESFLEWLTPSRIRRVLGNIQDEPGYSKTSFEPISVYGDDICIDTRLSPSLFRVLISLGFKPNLDKSFTAGMAVRESCGIYAMQGYDVTPVLYRVKEVRPKLSPRHVASQVSLINRAFELNWRSLYRQLSRTIMTWDWAGRSRPVKGITSEKNPIPFVQDPLRFGIRVAGPVQNNHLRQREHPFYQRDEIRSWTIRDTSESGHSELSSYEYKTTGVDGREIVHYRKPSSSYALERYLYMRWWATATRIASVDSRLSKAASRYDTDELSLVWRWTPSE